MKKPIDDTGFWSARLHTAKSRGNIKDAVYVTTAEDWKTVDQQHREFCEQYIHPLDNVLDAGCGYGRASEFLPGRYHGIDFCQDFVKEGHLRYPDKNIFLGDLTSTGFRTNHFDWVVCISIEKMVKDNQGLEAWDTIEQELLRICKRGILCLEYGNQTGTTQNRLIQCAYSM